MTQNQEILQYLKKGGTLTQLEAADRFKCWRLSGRILDLRRKGFDIRTRLIKTSTGKIVAEYYLATKILDNGQMVFS